MLSFTFDKKSFIKYLLIILFFFVPVFLQAQETDHISFKIDSIHSPHVHVRSITFSGNKITKEKIIKREMSMQEGDSILTSNLEEELIYNRRRILNLQLFSTVNYQVTLISPDSIDINYSLTEILYWIAKPIFSLADRNFNVWWVEQNHELDRTNMGMEVTRLNFRGRNEQIMATAQVGYNKYFDFSYKIPFIDSKLKQGMGISTTFETGREISYQTNKNKLDFYRNELYPYRKFQGKIHYTYRRKYVAIHELQLSYNNYVITQDLYNENSDFLGGKKKINYFDLSYIYNFNNTDIRIYPTRGVELKTILSKKGLWIDKDINRFDITAQAAFYHNLWNDFSGSIVFRGKYSTTKNQPYIFNRALGFKNEYVRGYEYYVIDGSRYALIRGNLRYKIMDRVVHQNILKFIKYVPVRIFGKIYDDIGYVYNATPGNSFLNNKFLNGYGMGLDIVVSYYLKLRVEYSFNHLNQNGLFLHGSKE